MTWKSGSFFANTRTTETEVPVDDGALRDIYRGGRIKEFLRQAVISRKNIVISGATGSAKTTLSNALIKHIPNDERIISIEDTPELFISQENCVCFFYSKDRQGLSQAGPKELLESGLRMRPDRILLQELRDRTAFYYIRNVNSGHLGLITSVHADSVALAFEQLALLIKESEVGRDIERAELFNLLKASIDVVVQCKRLGGMFRASEVYFRHKE